MLEVESLSVRVIENPKLVIPDPPWQRESSDDQTANPMGKLPSVQNQYQLETLTVHPYDWQIIDGESSLEKTEIRAWCLDRESKPYLLRVMNYPVFANLELPKVVDGLRMNWNQTKIRKVYNTIRSQTFRGKCQPYNYKDFKANKLYYYQDPRDPTIFLKLFFHNLAAMRACERLVSKTLRISGVGQVVRLKLHETKIPLVRKMLTEKRLGYSQWFSSQGRPVTKGEKVSTLEREFIIDWKTIKSLDVDWVTDPAILAVDIEVYSENRNAFPDAWNVSDDAYMTSCIYQRLRHPESLRKILIIYGVSSGPDEGDEYIFVKSEEEMCYKFAEIVNLLDPEIVTGYNIFGFDYPYLNKRMVRKGLSWPSMGRIANKPAILTGPGNWSSSGYGHNSIEYLQMDGRINVDMLHIIRREHKLPKYNLETVGQHFLGVGKDDVPAEMMFDRVKLMKILVDVLELLREPAEREEANRTGGPSILFLLKTSDSIVKYIQDRQAQNKTFTFEELNQLMGLVDYVLDEMNKIAKYCIKDSVLVIDLFVKLNTWIYLIQLSNVAGVTPLQLFTRGQQIRGQSLAYDLAAKSGFVLDSRQYTKMSWSGGFVWEPDPGLWEWVICLDFKSLYPNIIRAYNICWTTLVPPWSKIKDECCNVIEWDEPIDKDDYISEDEKPPEDEGDGQKGRKKKKGKRVYTGSGKVFTKTVNGVTERYIHYKQRWLKKEYREGLLPQLAAMLIDERNAIREKMKNVKDPIKKMIMNQRQLGLKVTANSLFGLLGANENGKLPLLEGAMSITAKGRELIKYSNDYIADKYDASIIYNDTDSTMVQIPNVDNGLDCLAWGKKLELELSAIFPDPLYLELEKCGRQLTLKKKNYAYQTVNKKGEFMYNKDGTPKYMVRGIPLARRDKSKWQLKIVKRSIDMLLMKAKFQEFLDMIVDNVVRTLRGEPDWKDFSIIKCLGSGYKDKTYFMKVFADQLALIGKPAKPGDRLEYVIVIPHNPPEKCLLGHKMRLLDTYLERLKSDQPEPIDYHYYVNNLLQKCVDYYWQVGFKKIISQIEAQNLLDDKWKILNELNDIGLGSWVTQALNQHNQDPVKTVAALLLTSIEKKVVMARRKHVSGRHIFDCRVNSSPIKTLLKGYKKDQQATIKPNPSWLEQAVHSLASPELYKQLYPAGNMSNLIEIEIQI